MIMPSHAKNVKLYAESLPLFARYQVESYLGAMFNPTVQLKSGGYIVIGVTEALVAIDVNSGRATKEGSIEETALKTNLEAADEVARQLRLRDLAGLIVIDFIDMDERKNNSAVEKRMKDRLKTDRARIQVGRISGFGLMEMSRQRLRPGMIEATTQPCQACHGTGLIRSDDNLALSILRQIEEEGTRRRSREVLVRVPVGIANYLMNQKREHVAQIEARYGMSVRIEGDHTLVSPDFSLEKFKTATRVLMASTGPVVSVDTSIMDQVDDEAEEAEQEEAPAADDAEGKPKRRRRRRRRGRGRSGADGAPENTENAEDQSNGDETTEGDVEAEVTDAAESPSDDAKSEKAEKPKSRRSRSRSKKSEEKTVDTESEADAAPEAAEDTAQEEPVTEEPVKKKRTRKPRKSAAEKAKEAAVSAASAADEAATSDEAEAEVAVAEPTPVEDKAAESAKEAATAEPVAVEAAGPAEAEDAADDRPKRRGWWSLGR